MSATRPITDAAEKTKARAKNVIARVSGNRPLHTPARRDLAKISIRQAIERALLRVRGLAKPGSR